LPCWSNPNVFAEPRHWISHHREVSIVIPGGGLLKGMAVTFKHFIGSYYVGKGLLDLLGMDAGPGLTTVEYPEQKVEHSERFRYFPFLVYDDTPDDLRCVACRICEQECPPQCIHIVMQKEDNGRPAKAHDRTFPAIFDIDVSVCMSCRICVDVCPFDAIEMDNVYELGTTERFDMLVHDKEALLKSADYFASIKPSESAVVNARLEQKAHAAAAKAQAAAEKAAAAKAAVPDKPPKTEETS
jgi:NADH-quinone oxidoreductase subunit I